MEERLVTRIVIGPEHLIELPPRVRERVLAQASEILQSVRRWLQSEESDSNLSLPTRQILGHLTSASASDYRYLLAKTAEEWLYDLYFFWPGVSRDSNRRPLTDARGRIIVVAGGSASAGEPDGWGYQMLRAIHDLKFDEVFGIT